MYVCLCAAIERVCVFECACVGAVMTQLKRQLLVLMSQTALHSPSQFKVAANWGHRGRTDLFTAMNSIVSGCKLVLAGHLSLPLPPPLSLSPSPF